MAWNADDASRKAAQERLRSSNSSSVSTGTISSAPPSR